LLGPFTGLQIYPRVAGIRIWRPLAVLATVLLSCALLIAVVRYAEMHGRLATVADSELYLMPRVSVNGSEVTIESRSRRLFDAVEFVVLLDTVSETPAFPPSPHGDKRPRVWVASDGLRIFSSEGSMRAHLPWSELSSAEGRLSLDGPELMDWLDGLLRRAVVYGVLTQSVAFFLYQLLLQLVFVFLHRTLFFRGAYLPGFRALFNCASLAAAPVLLLCTLAMLFGLGEIATLGLHACLLGVLVLLIAARVRIDNEASSADPAMAMGAASAGPDTPATEP